MRHLSYQVIYVHASYVRLLKVVLRSRRHKEDWQKSQVIAENLPEENLDLRQANQVLKAVVLSVTKCSQEGFRLANIMPEVANSDSLNQHHVTNRRARLENGFETEPPNGVYIVA